MSNNNKLIEKLKESEQEHSDLDQILIQLQEKHTVSNRNVVFFNWRQHYQTD